MVYSNKRTKQSKRNKFDITSSEPNSSNHNSMKVIEGRILDEETDKHYAWYLNNSSEANQQSKSFLNEDDDGDEDDPDDDPQHINFLKNLTKNGNFYKLKVSRDDETPRFLEYHEPDDSDEYDYDYDPPNHTNMDIINSPEDATDMQINGKEKISMAKNTSQLEHKNDVESCYQLFLEGCIRSEYGAFMYKGKRVNYEEDVTSSDSDIMILDGIRGFSEMNNDQQGAIEKDSSLRKELMHTLRKPYNEEEHKQLLGYVEQKWSIPRTLSLRGRDISAASGSKKSALDDAPPSFIKKLKAAENEPCKALNLLRGYRFWILKYPHEAVFEPWLDDECQKVLPSSPPRI